jgi:hypothetical protein
MLTLDECRTIEGETEGDEDAYFEAIQRAINEGAWNFQGSYGRAMMAAIEAGDCLLGRSGFTDAYGNPIPSRADVQAGTKGSLAFVANARGDEWAARLAAIE